ncbi:MAG: tRNA pseudouridine(55) synthase TruB [Melioribacteraceae bacterium]|nr:tRNA pseudouridine(55) synthase TruB [Melioribacteraceae bacterium]
MITKQTNKIDPAAYSEGFEILIDKNFGVSSFFIVNRIRKLTRIKKVGHAGTLDPNATGLLIICLGKKTKEIYKYQDMDKVYSGTITLGKRTESMDSETAVIEEKDYNYITEQIVNDTVEKFIGNIEQIPPMYSAIKHKGKSLYKYARKGLVVDRNPRQVNISRFDITKINMPDITFTITCSKGTYVRVLANDFGDQLGCGAYLSSLRRERIGEYSVDESLTLDQFSGLFERNKNEFNITGHTV